MAEFGSRGATNTALGLSIGALGAQALNGGLGNLLGGLGMTRNVNGCCAEDHLVNRYEAAQQAEIERLRGENDLLRSNTYTDSKILDLYRYVDGKFGCIEGQLSQQAVYNATNTATLTCLQNQVAVLQGLTKTVIPTASICPEPMARYNSWVAPSATTTT
jgi:hypothetical protein